MLSGAEPMHREVSWIRSSSDTHAFVKELTDAGMPEPQAEVLARTHAKLIDEKLATKQDLKELELRLTLRLGSMMVVAVGAVAALSTLL